MSEELCARRGARRIIHRCLGLEPDQQLVVLLDETTVETGVALAEAADSLGVPHTLILVPVSIQRGIPLRDDLSLLAQGAAREARAIIACVNSAPECLPFRRRVLETNWTARTRIGHMPGATPEVLKLADVDFDKLVADCWCIEIAMARGRRLELVSFTADGTPQHLAADIGGWERLPVASDGIISDGAWGNVPSGETYIAPLEGSAEGSLVVNGSIPGLVIGSTTEITLHFERGRLERIDPPDGPAARWLHDTQIAKAQDVGDPNWSYLAEIGVGTNPASKELTGNMLFDEKAAGTAHVALGTNAFMGGTVNASIHCDMVILRPTIRIDGKMILDRGRLSFVDSDWHEHHTAVPLEESPVKAAARIARSGVQVGESPDGRLQRILRPEPGRVSTCFVGDEETAQLAGTLYALIPGEGEWLRVEELEGLGLWEPGLVRRVLHVLWSFGLIDLG